MDSTPDPALKDLQRQLKYLERHLQRQVGRCIDEYGLIQDGDRILLGLSGGKDSWALLDLLLQLQRKAPIHFQLTALTVDPGFPSFDPSPLSRTCEQKGVPFILHPSPIAELIPRKPEEIPCAICSRIRRGILYSYAHEHGFTKIALGHNLDDLMETLLMNLFHAGRIGTMPVKLISDDGRNTVIRPLAQCDEKDLRLYTHLKGNPIVDFGCPITSQPGKDEGRGRKLSSRRQEMKEWIQGLEGRIPKLRGSVLRAMKSVKPSHLLDRPLQEAAKRAGYGDRAGSSEEI